MSISHYFVALLFTAATTVALPCVAQEQQSATPAVSGSGKANHVALWKNSTTLESSDIVAISGNVGIGTTAPAAKLEVNGNAQVDGNFSLSGSILETGVGQLLWAPNDGSYNLGVGLGALPATTAGTIAENTAVGYNALHTNTSGVDNTAVGFQALLNNTTAMLSTAIGAFALFQNTTGFGNTATGSSALYSNTSGFSDTASGQQALSNNTTGSFNTAIGQSTLTSNTTGSENTAIGTQAMYLSGTGSNNIAIGYQAGYGVINGSNNILIGNPGNLANPGDANTIRIGCMSPNGGGGAACIPGTGPQTAAFIAGITGVTVSGVPVLIDANGQLGTAPSSRRYKQDINDMADASAGLMQLRPVTFRYKKAYEDGSKPVQYGLIAEEVSEIYPDLVARSADGQIESVRYQLLDPMLLNELQKQHATIDAQKKQIQSLEERLARVEAMLAAGATGATGQ